MMILLVIAALALVGIVSAVVNVVTDGRRPMPTDYSRVPAPEAPRTRTRRVRAPRRGRVRA